MRIESLSVTDAPPVREFVVSDLADTVVIAGPNGVGKTRLVERVVAHLRSATPNPGVTGAIAATSKSERSAWGQSRLDMSSEEDMSKFRATIQVSRRRTNWTSSLINFESDRTIQNLQPLTFSWDFASPDAEDVGWETTFGRMRERFQDTVHSMYRLIEAQRQGISTRAVQLQRDGQRSMRLDFSDPMVPFKQIFHDLLGPKELVDPSPRNQRLEFRLGADVYEFQSLSSGEREVVNIAFDFLLRKPTDCIVFFDEPELHLHPELAYRLLGALENIGTRNQFIFLTHSPDIIQASLDKSVIFLSPAPAPEDPPANQAVVVGEGDAANRALRLLGQSIGIVALGRRIVLVEGSQSSLDKQTYGSILRRSASRLVLVPAGGRSAIESFAEVYESVLSHALWGVDFFMLCDGDTAPSRQTPQTADALANGRLAILSRYHLENYFLDSEVIARCFEPLEPANSWLRSPTAIEESLREIALTLVPYATCLTISSSVRFGFGNVDVMAKGLDGASVDQVETKILAKVASETERFSAALDPTSIATDIRATYARLEQSVSEDSDWSAIPGKPLLARFANRTSTMTSRLKNMYIAASADTAVSPFDELDSIFRRFELS